MKNTRPSAARRHPGNALLRIAWWCMAVCASAGLLPAQNTVPGGQLHYFARGTGRTTGHVITLTVCNPTPAPLRTAVGDCFIPNGSDYQGYVILQTYPIHVPPFGVATLPLEGYCTNVRRPAIPDGEAAANVSEWIAWSAATPLPAPGAPPGEGFLPRSEPPAGDLLALSYPGTQRPFPYQIDFNRHPRAATRLLIHAAWSAGQAFDQLVAEGKIQPARLGRNAAALRQEMIQQALWAYAARLEGATYDKNLFSAQFAEETEQVLNQAQTAFSAEQHQQTERQTQDVWANISLVGASAKLIAPNENDHRNDLFEETPAGPAADPLPALSTLLGNVDVAPADAGDRLLPALIFFKNNPSDNRYFSLRYTANSLWGDFIDQAAESLNAESETAPAEIFRLLGYVRLETVGNLTPDGRHSFENALLAALNRHVRHRVRALQAGDPEYLLQWRELKSWQSTPWYAGYCSGENPLKDLPRTAFPKNLPATSALPAQIELASAQWKTAFLPETGSATKKFPWWIPAAGAPLAGGLIYLLLREKGGDAPPAPLAEPDVLNLPCQGAGTVNVVANDIGDGIRVSAATGAPGVLASVDGPTGVQITSQGVAGIFTVGYVITDQAGQTAAGVVHVAVGDQAPPQISCPPAIALEGCGQAPSPTLSGQATATDDCSPAPGVFFTDELGGVPCARTVTRTWAATDAAGKTASCQQTIAVQDQTPPQISCPPAVSVAFGRQNDLALTGAAQAADACTPNVPLSHTDDLSAVLNCSGPILRTWTAADNCSNAASCTQTITVADQTPPAFSLCPPGLSVECGRQNDLSVTGQAAATDDCTAVPALNYTDDPSGFNGCTGTIRRLWTATDQAGNAAACEQLLAVSDQTPPEISFCPGAVTVLCGQENNLAVTGIAEASDACSGLAPVGYTDDLSQFANCEGLILRSWTAADPCGNTAVCEQAISVAPAPCAFTPTFALGPTVCGDCAGSISVTIFPPGQYAVNWSNGLTGTFITNLCAGDYAGSVTDLQNNCTQAFTATVPEVPLNLVVLEAIPPSSPSASDGRVRLQVNPPTGALPLEVFVNGIPVGFFGANVISLSNFPPGIYEIQVVNAAGCASNVVVVELFPQEYAPLPPPLEISRLSDPGMSPGFSGEFFEKQLAPPEHPPGTPVAGRTVWDQPAGIALGIGLGGGWQLRWEESRRQGWQHTAAGRRPLEWSSRSAGLRHFSVRSSRMAVFRDIAVSNTRVRSKAIPAGGPGEPLHLSAWTLTFGGGWRHNLCPGVAVEWSAGISLSRLPGDSRIHPGLGFRLSVPLQSAGVRR